MATTTCSRTALCSCGGTAWAWICFRARHLHSKRSHVLAVDEGISPILTIDADRHSGCLSLLVAVSDDGSERWEIAHGDPCSAELQLCAERCGRRLCVSDPRGRGHHVSA